MTKITVFFTVFLPAVLFLPALHAESVSNGQAVLEWKNGIMELRGTGKIPGRVIFRPYFTNGTKLASAKATVITNRKKAILLHGKECSLTFLLNNTGVIARVSAPRNAGFTVETATAVLVLPDRLTEDLIIEPGKDAMKIPSWLPGFTGLQGQGDWTLSCFPYLGRSDIGVSADLKTWDFRPQPLEEFNFVIQSGSGVWQKVEGPLDDKTRKSVDWKPPFKARYRVAFPMSGDLYSIGKPKYQVWDMMEELENGKRLIHRSPRVAIIDAKAKTGWSSGVFGTAPYPAYLPEGGPLQLIYPRLRNKNCTIDRGRPIFIYTYDSGFWKKRADTPLNFADEFYRPFLESRPSGSIGIEPATCVRTQDIEKIYYRGEARAKRDEIMDGLARIQIFVESIRTRIDFFRTWAEKMKKVCQSAADNGGRAIPELQKFTGYFDSVEKCYRQARNRMETPEKVYELGEQLLRDLDNRALDDEELEKRCKNYGRAVRTIGGAQDNCVAECHYAAKMIRLEALHAYLLSSSAAAKDFYRNLYRSTSRLLQNSFTHEGK